jgi:uncharacterized membrane protein YsdA (DUF1294 family)
VIALMIMLALWVGSALLVIPYLMHVGKQQVQQAAMRSPEPTVEVHAASAGEVGLPSAPFLLQGAKPSKAVVNV